MTNDTVVRGALPRVQWGPVIAGTLCALAVHIVLGLFGAAFGFAAEPADSESMGVAAGIWGLLVPLFASLVGAWVCVRMARETDAGGAYLHGILPWCIGLIAGALFLTSTMATGAISSATAASGNLRGTQVQRDLRANANAPRNEVRQDQAAKGAAAASGAGGLAALLGLCGAIAGAALGRRALTGEGLRMHRGRAMGRDERHARGYREEMGQTTGVAHAEPGGVVTTTPRTPDVARPDDPTLHH